MNPPEPRHHNHPAVVVISWVLGGGAAMGWLVLAFGALGCLMFSAMLFDAPGSEDNPYLWVVVYSLAALPVLCLFSAVTTPIGVALSQILRRRGRPKAGWASLAAAALLACLPLLGIGGVTAGFTLVNLLCDGSFSC